MRMTLSLVSKLNDYRLLLGTGPGLVVAYLLFIIPTILISRFIFKTYKLYKKYNLTYNLNREKAIATKQIPIFSFIISFIAWAYNQTEPGSLLVVFLIAVFILEFLFCFSVRNKIALLKSADKAQP